MGEITLEGQFSPTSPRRAAFAAHVGHEARHRRPAAADADVAHRNDGHGADGGPKPRLRIVFVQAGAQRGHGCASEPPQRQRAPSRCLLTRPALAGGGLGVVAGVLLGSYESITPPIEIPGQPAPPPRGFRREVRPVALSRPHLPAGARSRGCPARTPPPLPHPLPHALFPQAALTAKRTAVKARQWGRNFALVTGVGGGWPWRRSRLPRASLRAPDSGVFRRRVRRREDPSKERHV